jgi:hypothetical protein
MTNRYSQNNYLIFALFTGAITLLTSWACEDFADIKYEAPIVVILCLAIWFFLGEIINKLIVSFSNEPGDYFVKMKSLQTTALSGDFESAFKYCDTFVSTSYYAYGEIDGEGVEAYSLADGIDGGAPHMLIAISELTLSAEAPGPENTQLIEITGFDVLELASKTKIDFTLIGVRNEQLFKLTHEDLLAMEKKIQELLLTTQ